MTFQDEFLHSYLFIILKYINFGIKIEKLKIFKHTSVSKILDLTVLLFELSQKVWAKTTALATQLCWQCYQKFSGCWWMLFDWLKDMKIEFWILLDPSLYARIVREPEAIKKSLTLFLIYVSVQSIFNYVVLLKKETICQLLSTTNNIMYKKVVCIQFKF